MTYDNEERERLEPLEVHAALVDVTYDNEERERLEPLEVHAALVDVLLRQLEHAAAGAQPQSRHLRLAATQHHRTP